jgi:hypothetical protein
MHHKNICNKNRQLKPSMLTKITLVTKMVTEEGERLG